MSAPRKRAAIRKAEHEIDRLQQKIMLLEYQYSVLKSLAEGAALFEREACAKHIDVPLTASGHEFAAAIRARGSYDNRSTEAA